MIYLIDLNKQKMGEKPRSRLTFLKEKVRAFLSLPNCAFDEILSRLRLKDNKETEYRAQHEAGHALIYFLAGKSIEKAEISRLRGMTSTHLNSLLGSVIPFHAGEVSLSDSDEAQFAKEEPQKNALNYLAGIASTQDPAHATFFEKLLNEGLANGTDGDWEDISVPYAYIQERFEAVHHRVPAKEEINHVFHTLLNQVRAIFSQPQFEKALRQIKDLIKEHRLKRSINETILRLLTDSGFSPFSLEEMQRTLFSIDIDKIILASVRTENAPL